MKSLKFNILYCLLLLIGLNNLTAQSYYNKNDSLLHLNFEKGKIYLHKGKNVEALGYFQTALAYSPHRIAAQIMAGNACYNLQLYASAIEYNLKAIEIGNITPAYNNTAIIYGIIGEDELALEAVKYIDESEEKNLNKNISLGAIAERQARYNDALKYTHIAASTGKETVVPYYNLGVIHFDLNNLDSTLYYANKAISIDPNNPLGYDIKLSVWLKQNKSKQEYASLCKKIISLYSKNDQGYSSLKSIGDAYGLLGKEKKKKANLEKSLVILNKLIELYPYAYPLITDRAEIHTELGNYETAKSDFKRSLDINPLYKRTKDGLTNLLYK